MMRKRHRRWAEPRRRVLLALGLLALVAPVVAAPRTRAPAEALDGDLVNVRGDGRNENGVVETGGQFSNGTGPDGTYVFGIHLGAEAQAYLVLVWKRAANAPEDWTALNDKAIVETWLWTEPLVGRVLASPEQFNAKRDFLDVTPEQRRRIAGAFPLKGKVHVRRFRSNVDFQLDLDVATGTDPARRIKGTLYAGGSRPEGEVVPEPVPKNGPPPPPGVDLSDPLKVVRAYAEGLRDGDEAKLRSVHLTAGKEWDAAIDMLARWARGSARLERAAVVKFGRAGADRVMSAMFMPPAGSRGRELLESLADAKVTVRGDRANVDVPVVDEIELRRVNGKWGIFATPAPDAPPGGGGDGEDLFKVVTAAQDRVAPEIEAGRLQTVEAAVEALNQAAKAEAKKLGIEDEDEDAKPEK